MSPKAYSYEATPMLEESHVHTYPYAVIAVVVGTFLTAFGVSTVFATQAPQSSLYSSAQVAHPSVAKSLLQRGQQPSLPTPNRHTTHIAGDVIVQAAIPSESYDVSVSSSTHSPQGAMMAVIGAALAAIGAALTYKWSSRQEMAMAAVSAIPEDPLPTLDEMLKARQEYLKSKGMGPGARLAPGEVIKPVTLPGYDQPVDLLEMYKHFEELLGDTVQNPTSGSRVMGTVFDTDDRGASIDFGGKTIGYCPLEELALCKVRVALDAVRIGEQREFEIIVPANQTRKEKEEELTYLSLKRIAEGIAWKRLQQYRENDITFTAVLKGKNRGGYMIEVEDLGVPGFLPKSQATSDLATAPETAEPSTFMDQLVEVKVLDLDAERQRLVVSQRAANPRMAPETFKVGTVHEGTVQNVKPYGVFVDVNGMSGLLHISQISHNRIDNVDSIFQVGDKIKCMVLSQDQVQGRLALSTKRLEPTHGDMLTNPQLVYEKAEEMAERFREDIAAAEKRMQEFEQKLAEQNTATMG